MTHVYTIAGKHFPAWHREDGILVDLRHFAEHGEPTNDNLVFRPECLTGVPQEIIDQASESVPPGFILVQ